VCQDLTHVFVSVARTLGIPARYVSGHLFRRDGAVMQEAAHAWAEAWIDDLGWTAFDPTNGVGADDAYIRVAAGHDYLDVAPFAGARSGGGTETLHVAVQVKQARLQTQMQTQS
jgi:transglutaminase-like putative cysteine protease